jgi:CheY-specific phosphatase CheX
MLIVGMPGGRLTRIAEPLKLLGYQILQVPALDPALQLVENFPHLSLVMIEEEIAMQGGRTFVASSKENHPNLPIVWACAGESSKVVFEHVTPDIILARDFEISEFEEKTATLLCEHYYPAIVTQELVDCGNVILGTSFGCDTSLSGPALKTTQTLFGDTNALITFSGERISGHLVVSANHSHLAKMYERNMGEELDKITREEAGDLAGEIANQVLGRFKNFFEAHSSKPFALGLPIVIYGTKVSIGYSTRRPTLILGFQEEPGTIYIDFGFEVFDPADLDGSGVASELLDHGEVFFL